MQKFIITNDYIKECHEANKSKGWWSKHRSDKILLTLIGTEYVEKFEELRAGKPAVYIIQNGQDVEVPLEWSAFEDKISPRTQDCPPKYHKPEGILIELVDVVIRIADWAGALGLDVSSWNEGHVDMSMNEEHCYDALAIATSALDVPVKLELLYKGVVQYCETHNYDLNAAMAIKAQYNTFRSYRHGGKQF